jgi:hypothetical protein
MDLPLFKKGFTIHLNLQNMMNMFRGKPRLEVGMTVEANYNGQGKWYKGQITKDRENGTFDIEFENGKNENAVPLKSIKTMETSVSLADRSIDSQTSRFKIPAIQDHFPVMFESAGSSKAPSVAGDDHSVTSASSNNSRANKTTISKFFHFGSTATTPITPNIPPVIVESKTISMDTSSIASQAKAALVDLQPVLVPSYDIPAEPVVVVSKLSRKKLNKTSMKERIRRFYETDTKAIDLSDLDLVMVPIAELKGLSESVRSLNLSRNNLFEGLLHMRLFSTLVQLDLSLNGLTSLQSADGSFSSLRALKSVDLSRNALTAFPVELLGLSSLETLVMHHNLLSALPPQDQMSSLKALCLLDVSHNCLDGVTDELEGLSRLGDLNLGHNRDDSGREMDTRSMGARAKELYEKVALL